MAAQRRASPPRASSRQWARSRSWALSESRRWRTRQAAGGSPRSRATRAARAKSSARSPGPSGRRSSSPAAIRPCCARAASKARVAAGRSPASRYARPWQLSRAAASCGSPVEIAAHSASASPASPRSSARETREQRAPAVQALPLGAPGPRRHGQPVRLRQQGAGVAAGAQLQIGQVDPLVGVLVGIVRGGEGGERGAELRLRRRQLFRRGLGMEEGEPGELHAAVEHRLRLAAEAAALPERAPHPLQRLVRRAGLGEEVGLLQHHRQQRRIGDAGGLLLGLLEGQPGRAARAAGKLQVARAGRPPAPPARGRRRRRASRGAGRAVPGAAASAPGVPSRVRKCAATSWKRAAVSGKSVRAAAGEGVEAAANSSSRQPGRRATKAP